MAGQIKCSDEKYNRSLDSHKHTLESWTGPGFSLFFFFSFFFFVLFSFFLFYKCKTYTLMLKEKPPRSSQCHSHCCLSSLLLNRYYEKYTKSHAERRATLEILRNKNRLIPHSLSVNVTLTYKITEQKALIKWNITTATICYSPPRYKSFLLTNSVKLSGFHTSLQRLNTSWTSNDWQKEPLNYFSWSTQSGTCWPTTTLKKRDSDSHSHRKKHDTLHDI